MRNLLCTIAVLSLIGGCLFLPLRACAESEEGFEKIPSLLLDEMIEFDDNSKPDLHMRQVSATDTDQDLQRELNGAMKKGKYDSQRSKPGPDERGWPSFLPIWGDEARKRGYELPVPLGVAGSFFYGKRDIDVNRVNVTIQNVDLRVDKYASFKVKSRERNWSMRFDAWVFPFLNLYVIGGYTREHSDVYVDGIKMNADWVSGPDSTGSFNSVTKPYLSPSHLRGNSGLDLDGPTYGVGGTLVTGYKRYFFVLDMNYTVTDLKGDLGKKNTLNEQVDAFLLSVRTGWRTSIFRKKLSLWLGETYWGISQTIEGKINAPHIGKISFEVDESPTKPFSTHIGTYLEITKEFNFLLDVGSNFSDMFCVTPVVMYRF